MDSSLNMGVDPGQKAQENYLFFPNNIMSAKPYFSFLKTAVKF